MQDSVTVETSSGVPPSRVCGWMVASEMRPCPSFSTIVNLTVIFPEAWGFSISSLS
jgi:hypothetical protein